MLRVSALLIFGLQVTSTLARVPEETHSISPANKQLSSKRQTYDATDGFSVFSWNVSKDAFVREPELFKALVQKAQANILLLDEVSSKTNTSQLLNALPSSSVKNNTDWHINFGQSGGWQRTVIASRFPIQTLAEFSRVIPYPEADKQRLKQRIVQAGEAKYSQSLDSGISVNGVIVIDGEKRLLVVSLDLECCGNDPSSWEEEKRRVEVREIRKLVMDVIQRKQVDGIIIAGDFNLVSTVMPLVIITGPYKKPYSALIAADLMHIDGKQTWTWDGRGTAYPSRVMDLVIYSPQTVRLIEGHIFDPEDISSQEQHDLGLAAKGFNKISEHLPIFTKFVWND